MSRRVLAVATFGFALVIGVLVIVNSTRPRVERVVTPAPTSSAPVTPPATPRAETPERPAAPTPSRRPARPSTAGRASSPAPAAPIETVAELGTLRIDADVPRAQVFIDRQFVGTTPLTAESVKPGTHQINVTAEGFDGIAQTIDVEPGPRDLTFRFREVRLDAALAVVHKHRVGSCRGRLVATVDGIRYETADKEDGFTAPFSDLESFQVDYQDKNLRVKLRKGRQFNFTDPDGNADRLFVFHRDVEKARQKLSQ
ncbi:MAG TPA: PEGA domain-containing protein [Vicinamibacterales bacterium]|nr:PEGA domain-containing protein [Vicinamibacterales bacterium]